MRPAYAPSSQIYVGEALLMTDPWSADLAAAISLAYTSAAPAELPAFEARLARARGLTSAGHAHRMEPK